MGKDIIAVFYREPNWFHHAATGGSAVAGMDIDVSAPETFWTVVGITISCDGSATVCTGEIFNVALESFVHSSARVMKVA